MVKLINKEQEEGTSDTILAPNSQPAPRGEILQPGTSILNQDKVRDTFRIAPH